MTRIRPINVPCGHCSGTGEVQHGRATQIYNSMSVGEWVSTQGIALRAGISPENAANVLALLLSHGRVERRGSGSRYSPYQWSRKGAA